MSEWEEWVRKVTRGATTREVAEKIHRSHTTARRWMRDGATPDQVIALALAYNADVIQALVVAGWLKPSDVGNINIDTALRRLSEVKLAGEMYRRAMAKERKAEPPSVFDQPPNLRNHAYNAGRTPTHAGQCVTRMGS